ncbi:MAG: response regulator [Verrucomicrobiota bacterium]|nr:response regulator [Verrucomicrobiota bacterium]
MKELVLIDNDALTRALISQSLTGHGWRVFEADNGEAGIELALKHQPAAVLCALRTPKRNGFKVCNAIREQKDLNHTRVVLTSVSGFANDRDSAFAAGADDYLVKPIEPAELLRVLEKCTNGAGATAAKPEETKPPTGPTLIRFWGVRGSIPTPGADTAITGGNTSCVEVRIGNQVIILDAGSGIRRLGQSLMKEFRDIPVNITMLVTHTHWDHIQGFPFFMPAYNPRVNIRILGYEGAVHGLRGALFEQMQSAFFPVGLNQMAGRVTFEELEEMEFNLGGIKITSMFANHPGICLGYRLTTGSGDIVYLPDHEAYERYEVERQRAAGETSAAGLEHARLQDEQVINFLRDAAVVMADSQYDLAEYETRRGWGHTCADDTVDLAIRANVKQLFLFHHDPDHNDAKIDEMVERAEGKVREKNATLKVAAAREGTEYLVGDLPNE